MDKQRRKFIKWLVGMFVLLSGGKLFLSKGKDKEDALTGATPEVGKKVKKALYSQKRKNKAVICRLCFRECIIPEGGRGFCRNRENIGGELYTLVYNFPCSLQIDPIEKEPVFHYLPGTRIFCLSTASCNFRCKFCQNWHISQAAPEEIRAFYLTPEDIVEQAKKNRCPSISHTYAEPLVHFEYLLDVARKAKEKDINFIFHSNGSLNPEPLKEILEYSDVITIDLKSTSKSYYKEMCSAVPEPVLRNLKAIKKSGTHLEIVNLLLPVGNSEEKTVKNLVGWIKDNLGDEVPLHFTRFWPSYKLKNLPPTPVKYLERAKKIADDAGLKFVYIGNVPGHKANSTYCPGCKKRIIERTHFRVYAVNIEDGRCIFCKRKIPGRFT